MAWLYFILSLGVTKIVLELWTVPLPQTPECQDFIEVFYLQAGR